MKTILSLSILCLASSCFAAGLVCDGSYTNAAGVNLAILKTGDIVMTFGGNRAMCSGVMTEGRKMKLTCMGNTTEGEFSEKCDSLTFSTDTYKRK